MLKNLFKSEGEVARRTQLAYIGMRLLGTPCWYLLSLLAFILYKNLHLTPLQITVIVALKPASSLLSPYWSQAIYQRPDKILRNLKQANFLRHLPFLFMPWIDSPWFAIASFGLYMTLSRSAIPGWMELFKYNLPKTKREEIVSYGTTIDYLGTAALAIGAGFLLDHYQEMWRYFFAGTAALGLLSTLFLTTLPPIPPTEKIEESPPPLKEKALRPWRQVWELISKRKDFIVFQIGFMLGGAGLMIMQPALPQFFIDILHLSFTEMGLAIALCKGIGVAITSPLWTRLFRKLSIFQLSALVTFFATLFPFLLLATSFHIILLYCAYAFYGVMQAGSELSWHMSGLVFAGEKDSSTFSVTNVLTVGLRGCVVPAMGSLLLPFIHPLGVILFGAILCSMASGYFLFHSRVRKVANL